MSARTAQRLSRILAMLPWVIANPGASLGQVGERFGYSRAELIDDLNLVMVCGLPGYGPGDLMWAEVDGDEVVVDAADYFAASPRLSAAEALTLLASGLALISTGQAPPALERAVDKLSKVLLPPGEELVAIDLAGEPALVGLLRRAAADHVAVEITYTSLSHERTTERGVEPWRVFSSLGNWYLSGFCRLAGGGRVFRIDRIRAATPTEEVFTPPAELPPPVVHYTPSEEDVRATLRLHPAARWVAEYYPVEVIADEGEDLVVEFFASDPSVIARLVVRLGATADLVAGEEVRTAAGRLRAEILARYEEG